MSFKGNVTFLSEYSRFAHELFRSKLSQVLWTDVMLLVSYLSCMLTPVEIGIVQDIDFNGPLFLFLLLCDGVAVVDVYFSFLHDIWKPFRAEQVKEHKRLEKLRLKSRTEELSVEHGTFKSFLLFLIKAPIKNTNKVVIFLRAISASPFFLLPLGGLIGISGKFDPSTGFSVTHTHICVHEFTMIPVSTPPHIPPLPGEHRSDPCMGGYTSHGLCLFFDSVFQPSQISNRSRRWCGIRSPK